MAKLKVRCLSMILVSAGLGGCTMITSASPMVGVLDVQLIGLGVAEQRISTLLCATNPNANALSFKRVTVVLDISGQPSATGATDLPVILPPQTSVAVPFTVVTTVQNLGPQLLGVLRSGSISYRMHGTVTLQGSLGIVVPFSRSGQVDPLTGTMALADAAVDPATTPCTPAGR